MFNSYGRGQNDKMYIAAGIMLVGIVALARFWLLRVTVGREKQKMGHFDPSISSETPPLSLATAE